MVIEISDNVIESYVQMVQGSVMGFLPLMSALFGIFIAFAIFQSIAFILKKAIK